jgi:hypothetical protein
VSALVEGARLATNSLFDANAPVSTPFMATTATARVVLVHDPASLGRARYLHQLLTEATVVCTHTHTYTQPPMYTHRHIPHAHTYSTHTHTLTRPL